MREKTQKAEKLSVLLLCCFVVLLFYFNIHFLPANWVFTAHSVILTILKAEPGEQGQRRKAAITQKDFFYQ